MTTIEIEEYLTEKNERFDHNVLECIEKYRLQSIDEKDESRANYFWCLKQIYIIQKEFVSAISLLNDKKHEDAWLAFDRADNGLSILENNYVIDADDRFHLFFFGEMIKEYQKLFPYHYFFSRECVVQEEKCSICGRPISFRHPCGHKPGKVYMGELCQRIITKARLIAVSLVTDPVDKYAFVKVDGKEYNYGMLDNLMRRIQSPYDAFYVNTIKVKLPEDHDLHPNAQCLCGSGRENGDCHKGKPSELIDHHIIHFLKPISQEDRFCGFFGTWKSSSIKKFLKEQT